MKTLRVAYIAVPKVMSSIKETIFSFVKGDNLIGHLSGYVESRISLLKLEFAEDIIEKLSKGISEGVVYVVLFLFAGSFLLFFSVGFALYLNTFFDRPHTGYWIVAGIYLFIFLVTLVLRKSLQRGIQKHIMEATRKND